jgi:phosphatidylserine/phosphatidylglycerophosphate/cardiolipin synthase-like enzyme
MLLAATGCQIQVPAAAPDGTSTAGAVRAGTSAVTRSGPLIVEPGAGFSPVYRLLGGARHSIDVTMYEFSDTTAEHDLAAAARRGVRVRVILDRRERSVNSGAYSYLGAHRVTVTWSSPDYRYTHQKTVIIDGATAVIMTANLTSRYYATSRDFMVIDTERADVSAITAVFDADFTGKAVRPGDGTDLVWSPAGSEGQLLGLINGATSSLRIYSEEMGDQSIENALVKAAERGVEVQVCGENENGE